MTTTGNADTEPRCICGPDGYEGYDGCRQSGCSDECPVCNRTLDLDRVVVLLAARGVPAYVEQTGGGVATIYAGKPYTEEGWGDRYPAIAGPGWFEGHGSGPNEPVFTMGRAYAHDFWIGPDDDGETQPPAFPADGTEETAAERIAATVAAHVAPST